MKQISAFYVKIFLGELIIIRQEFNLLNKEVRLCTILTDVISSKKAGQV